MSAIVHGSYVDKMKLLQDMPHDFDFETRQKFTKYIESVDGINLLERDKGKEPVLEECSTVYHELRADGTGGFRRRDYLDWKCPTCGWFVGELYCGYGRWHIQSETSYCAKCGQRIDWTIPKEDEKRRYEETKAKEREEWEKKHGSRLDNMHENRRRKYWMLNVVSEEEKK